MKWIHIELIKIKTLWMWRGFTQNCLINQDWDVVDVAWIHIELIMIWTLWTWRVFTQNESRLISCESFMDSCFWTKEQFIFTEVFGKKNRLLIILFPKTMLSVSHYSYFWTMQFTISKTQYVDSWDIARLSKRNDNYDGLIITKSDFDNHEIFNLKIEIISSDGINCVHGQIVVFRLKNYVLYRCFARSVSFTCAG